MQILKKWCYLWVVLGEIRTLDRFSAINQAHTEMGSTLKKEFSFLLEYIPTDRGDKIYLAVLLSFQEYPLHLKM